MSGPREGTVRLGILRLAKRYSVERLEAACARACFFKTHSYRSVDSILKSGLDDKPLTSEPPLESPRIEHENIRGADAYQ